MNRFAVISDIHSNLHALEAVLARIGEMGLDQIICLGDVVGYGPFPGQCLNLVVRSCSPIVIGNHDLACVDPQEALTFNGAAREALDWTRRNLGPLHMDAILRLPAVARVGQAVTCVHDCPVPAPTDYVHDVRIAALAFAGFETPLCLLGHTHVPMVFEAPILAAGEAVPVDDVTAYSLSDGTVMNLDADKRYICNPGSVGQPRDADPRASFAVLDLDQMTFTLHRQEYDIDAAQMATQRAGLPFVLAERLAIGA